MAYVQYSKFIEGNYLEKEEHVYIEFDMPSFCFDKYTIYAKYVYNECVLGWMNLARDNAAVIYEFKNGPYNYNHLVLPTNWFDKTYPEQFGHIFMLLMIVLVILIIFLYTLCKCCCCRSKKQIPVAEVESQGIKPYKREKAE